MSSPPPPRPRPYSALPPPGWYPDPHGVSRFWDGHQWTVAAPQQQGVPVKMLVSLVVLALTLIGTSLALFTSVSLLTGTGTVWTGAVLAVLGAVAGWVARRFTRLWVAILATVLAMLAVASAVSDQHQLDQRRQQLEHIGG